MTNIYSIAGSTGFIGSRFCDKYPDITIRMKREQREPETNQIINFISTTNNYAFRDDICVDINTNVIVMLEMLDEARKKFGSDFVFNQISTWSVYGSVGLPASETTECNPTGFYSVSKRTAEQLLITFCEVYGAKYRIFRLCNVIGESARVIPKTKNALQYLIGELRENRDITLYNNGDFLREFIYVDDVCDGIMLGASKGNLNEIYNIGTGVFSIYGEIIRYCKDRLHSKSKIKYDRNPIYQGSVQAKNMYFNVDKINNLGFKPKYNVYEALDKIMGVSE